jgi:hypothetical protein
MAIKIIKNEEGNCINFHGTTRPAYWNNCLTAEVDAVKTETINVVNDISSTSTAPKYEFYNIPYTEFVDASNTPFASASDCAAYINTQAAGSATHAQGYLGILSPFYFGGTATSSDIVIEEVDTWMDVIMTIHSSGVSDQRPLDMKNAQALGYEGDGTLNNPIVFLLEGLVEKSFATLRTSLSFTPDEDGGRLDSRLFLERHTGAGADFTINAAGLAMESGADEEYPHLISTDFFVGDTIDTNGPGDAGKVRFQIKSDVTGTVSMNEMALFINR